MRLPDNGLRSEILPLVTAFNRALDWVERGFTSRVSSLPMPLTNYGRTGNITAALEEIEGSDDFVELSAMWRV